MSASHQGSSTLSSSGSSSSPSSDFFGSRALARKQQRRAWACHGIIRACYATATAIIHHRRVYIESKRGCYGCTSVIFFGNRGSGGRYSRHHCCSCLAVYSYCMYVPVFVLPKNSLIFSTLKRSVFCNNKRVIFSIYLWMALALEARMSLTAAAVRIMYLLL
jgi:hypothetical protein